MRAFFLLLLLAGCSEARPLPVRGGYPLLLPGQRLLCIETIIQMGLPFGERFSVIGFLKRTVECELKQEALP